ncbi:MAG TPA: DUF523 domain-containing protein [Firmicutes bacterium]|nr:DUF523 domain-containing protein [Bacillota bacterium]
MILVSACLAGIRCRYDGRSRSHEDVLKLVAAGNAFPVCPEQLGGLPTPRARAEIVGGDGSDVLRGCARVVDESGRDVTKEFVRGATECLRLARVVNAEKVVLCEGSPSCGVTRIADGTFSGKKVPGMGVTAALLRENGFHVVTLHPTALWQ